MLSDSKAVGGAGVTSAGVAGVRRDFISILAYTYWLALSRRQTVICDLGCDEFKLRGPFGIAASPRQEPAPTGPLNRRAYTLESDVCAAVSVRVSDGGDPVIRAAANILRTKAVGRPTTALSWSPLWQGYLNR